MSRAPRFSFGIEVVHWFDPQLPDHRERGSFIAEDGYAKVKGGWSQIASKVSTHARMRYGTNTLFPRTLHWMLMLYAAEAFT